MVANDSLPLRHLHRMHLIISGNLADRFDAHQSFQSNLGFEGTRVSFPFSFAHSSAVLSRPAESEKPNLTDCPNFGVHFWAPRQVWRSSYERQQCRPCAPRAATLKTRCRAAWQIVAS